MLFISNGNKRDDITGWKRGKNRRVILTMAGLASERIVNNRCKTTLKHNINQFMMCFNLNKTHYIYTFLYAKLLYDIIRIMKYPPHNKKNISTKKP